MTASQQLDILRRIQRILEEGDFVATYKFALLQALADLSVEQATEADGTLRIRLEEIATKIIDYYWRQTAPFADGILRQNTGRQAAIVSELIAARAGCGGNLADLRRDSNAWFRLVVEVARVVKTMPLWKLQTVGREVDEFLYRKSDFANGTILLLPGAADALRSFHGLITHLIRGSWLDHIRVIEANRDLLGDSVDLYGFMFGSGRQNLDGYRSVLREHQSARCFYCLQDVRDDGVADHFIPWVRYPLDLGHNFVFAHAACNNAKSDYLAHPEHLSRWREYNLDRGDELASRFRSTRLPHEARRSTLIAHWAYDQGELAGAHVWLGGREVLRLDSSWRRSLTPWPAVAEPEPPYRTTP